MHRLFVAISPPAQVRDGLLDLMEGINGARWQSDEQLHVTLRFIGEVDGRTADDVHAALGTVYHAPIELSVSGLGVFDRRGTPGVAWAGLTPAEPLRALHKKIDQALVRAGLEPERRAYYPHITLARLGRGAGPVAGFLEQPIRQPLSFVADSFGLYESQLLAAGAVHTQVERYPLGG